MFGNLTNPDRKTWTEAYEPGETIKTFYQHEWRDGVVVGKDSTGEYLVVDVLNEDGSKLFAKRLTTKDAVKKADA